MRTIRLQQFFHANGIDETNVRDRHIKKSESYSNSQILPRDYERREEIVLVIKEMAEHLAIRLRKGKKLAGGLSLWVRHSYQSNAPSLKVSCKIDPTQSTLVIQNEALRMFSSKYQGGPVREIGIGGFHLSDENIKQLTLFETMLEDDKQVNKQEALQQEVRAYDSGPFIQ